MSSPKQTITKKFISPGDVFCIDILGICNNSSAIAEDVQVELHTPPGLIFENYNVPQGMYDESTGIWTIGILYPGQSFDGPQTPNFCYRVAEYTDDEGNPVDIGTYTGALEDLSSGDCFAPYLWTPVISNGECEDCNPDDNSYCIEVTGLTCCDVSDCLTGGEINCELITL